MQRRFRIPLLIALASAGLLAAAGSMSAQQPAAIAQQKKLPAQLADSTFWRIISEFSEPEQTFGTYMVSNENFYPKLVADLNALNLRGGAYVGVAPEQNYHYIAALRPEIAFILDIRRQAVMQHMLFKTVFELAPNRADFISLLFTKPRPAGVANNLSAFDTWAAFWYVPTDTSKFTANFTRILDHLRNTHKFPLSAYDSSLLHFTYGAFYTSGPNMVSSGSSSINDQATNTFGNLTSTPQSFMATDEGYQVVRQLHLKNLVIPITGDFAGVKSLRTIGQFLHEHGVQLNAFYVSNVETYLNRDGKTQAFYQNMATLPSHPRTALIRGISPGRVCLVQNVIAMGFSGC